MEAVNSGMYENMNLIVKYYFVYSPDFLITFIFDIDPYYKYEYSTHVILKDSALLDGRIWEAKSHSCPQE